MMIYTYEFEQNKKNNIVQIDADNCLLAKKKLDIKYKHKKNCRLIHWELVIPSIDTKGILTDYSKDLNLNKESDY